MFRVSGAEVRDKANAAADVAKDKINEVKNTADKKIDEAKPKVNEAVNDAKQTGMSFELRQKKDFSRVRLTKQTISINTFCSHVLRMFKRRDIL